MVTSDKISNLPVMFFKIVKFVFTKNFFFLLVTKKRCYSFSKRGRYFIFLKESMKMVMISNCIMEEKSYKYAILAIIERRMFMWLTGITDLQVALYFLLVYILNKLLL